MQLSDAALLTAGVLVVALLYASVGHAGASGYIAVMTLVGMSAAAIKPTALVLNVLVATIGTAQYVRAGHFSWRIFWRFALFAVPLAFAGGYVDLPVRGFKALVGVVLLASAARFATHAPEEPVPTPPKTPVALAVGGGLGLLAGLTGTGGGIFLTPLLILFRWARTKTASAVSAAFILVNSIAGLAGNLAATRSLPRIAVPLALTAVLGGALGSWLGARRLDVVWIKRLLAVVLTIAGFKLVGTALR